MKPATLESETFLVVLPGPTFWLVVAALVVGDKWSEAGNAATALIVNIICVVAAESATGLALRKRLGLRAEPIPRPEA